MIPHNRPSLGAGEANAAAAAVTSGWVAPGPNVRSFEAEFAAFFGLSADCVAACSSGTAALFLALFALDAGGLRIAVPAYVCAALRNAVAMIGAREVLIDCAADSPNVDWSSATRSLCDIAIATHMFGIPAALPQSDAIGVIEDVAQALGATAGGTAAGLGGRIGVFSFYATKLMTSAGLGGAIISHDIALVAAVRDYLDFDCRRDERRRFNLLMSDVQAAVARVQLRRLPGFLERRQEIFARYRATGWTLLDAVGPDVAAVRYRAVIHTPRARELLAHLGQHGVEAIVPIERWELPGGTFPNAESLSQTTVSLPVYPTLSDTDVDTIVSALQQFA